MRKEIKYSLKELIGVGFTLVVLGVAIYYGLNVLNDVGGDWCEESSLHNLGDNGNCYVCPNASYNSYWLSADQLCANGTPYGETANVNVTPNALGGNKEFNASYDSALGVAKIPEKLETIATVIVASVIIGILVTYLWSRFVR